MPTRILFRLFLLAGLVAPLCAFALGVGPLEVRSALNQNFEAEIPLIVNNPAELTGLTVRVARQQDFDQLGVERLDFLSKLRFSVQAPPGGPRAIMITSIEPIREPNFNLLLEVTWPRGRLLRDFPVQLDPELYANRRQPAPPPAPIVAPPPVAATPAATPTLPSAPPVSFEGASFYGPVRPGETLLAIANRVRPSTAISLPQMMAVLVAGNPEAFTNANPNTLRTGSVLKVPTPQALGVRGAPAPASVPVPAPELATAPIPVPAEPAAVPAPPAITQPEPTPAPPISPPAATTPAAPVSLPAAPVVPPTVGTTPPATEIRPAPAPSLAEQPREIVPQASIPQTPPAPVAPTEAVTPPAAQPPAVPPPPPSPAAPAAPAPKPAAPPVEAEVSWLSNPVVWIAVLLIVLAVAAMLLLPLIRRPARPKSTAGVERTPAGTPEPASELPITRTQIREPRSRRPEVSTRAPAAEMTPASVSPTSAPGASPRAAEPVPTRPAPRPAGAPPPKPIDELLKDIDFGLGEGRSPAMAGGKGAGPAPGPEMRLPDAEPPTASVTRDPGPFAPAKSEQRTPPPPPKVSTPTPPQVEPPPELRLDKQSFDFGDLEFETTARPIDLPPLEMKPSASRPTEPPLLEPGISKPGFAAKAAPASEPKSKPAIPKASDLKFEFADVTREPGKTGVHEDLRLDKDLEIFGGDTLDLGKMEAGAPGGGEMMGADYVETKLDLATAYLDMGDQVGARSLLEDVLREGDASQKKRAGELLKKLG
ncbi:MAG: FimV/HubP family polar landmark protein [Candidatus Competibacter sp.]|nr:FimV/HubP family polar landmark protein [Candidatus Competibacter sp.]